jgi:hypothetical protein
LGKPILQYSFDVMIISTDYSEITKTAQLYDKIFVNEKSTLAVFENKILNEFHLRLILAEKINGL